MDLRMPRIICAAVRRLDGCVVAGPRHFDGTMWCQILGIPLTEFKLMQSGGVGRDEDAPAVEKWAGAEEGFIDQFGKFYTREAAWTIAYDMGQIDPQELMWQLGRLHSEHLY